MYCATCILHWALHKEEPWCPQCKQPFAFLLTYRTLDGELQDFPSEEPVTLLKRAPWFEEHLRFSDKAAASLVEESRLADAMAWQVRRGGRGGASGRRLPLLPASRCLPARLAWPASSAAAPTSGSAPTSAPHPPLTALPLPPAPPAHTGLRRRLRPGRGRGD